MKTIAIYAQSEQCGSRRRSGRVARSSLSRLAFSQTGMSAGRSSMEWKSRRRDVPERLEPSLSDGALAEEEGLDRFVFNAEGEYRIRQGKSPGEIIDDPFYVKHNNSPLPCAALKEGDIGTAILV